MYNKNAAYDLSLFKEEPKKSGLIKLNVDKLRRIRARKAQLSLVLTGLTFCTVAAIGVSVFIAGQAELAQCTEEITQLSKKQQENDGVYTQLCMEKKCKISSDELADRLKSQYNVSRTGNEEYINVMNDNKAQKNNSDDIFANMKDSISDFVITCSMCK